MGIRKTQKNRLDGAELTLVTQVRPKTPQSTHPLVFWTLHTEDPVEVDLREFAYGKSEKKKGINSDELTFTGRPGLINQLRPVLEESLALAAPATVKGRMFTLRAWWALLDKVETEWADPGKPTTRVDDVRQLTQLHREAARRTNMDRSVLSGFRTWVDVARQSLGGKPTYWQALEKQDTEKHIPALEQREAVRHAVKRNCLRVIDKWDMCDRLNQRPEQPAEHDEEVLWQALRHLREIQQGTGSAVPTIDELNRKDQGRDKNWCFNTTNMRPTTILQTAFASKDDALAVFTQCIATTGWNTAVMLNLDVGTEFLRNHPKDNPTDPNCRWVLTGIKERARRAEQLAMGPWKSSYLPGSLIKRYMERMDPLREVLKARLTQAELRYKEAFEIAPNSPETTKLFKKIAPIRQASKSIWLYLDTDGNVCCLDNEFMHSRVLNAEGRQLKLTYMESLVDQLNSDRQRKGKDSIPNITYRDFRLWFADYLHRSYLGNLLVVMLGLGHKGIRTTQRYVNTNLANRDAEKKVIEFQEILTQELGLGRIDMTILAYKVRHGEFDQEKEEKLVELRRLPKSRQGIGCKDPRNPPQHLKATPGQSCDSQRCLLCKQHAVLLPESVDGIAMREAELKAMQEGLPMTSFVEGGYQMELENQKLALRLFDPAEVSVVRAKWSLAISRGQHIVPGLPVITLESLS